MRLAILPPILLPLLLLPLLLSGCYLSRSADIPEELARTWADATVAVPFSAVDPGLADVSGRMAEVEGRLRAAEPARQLPVVVFLHGCNGLHSGYRVDVAFLRARGYAVVAPNSFARAYKPASCDWRSKTGGSHPGVIGFRLAETEYALDRVRGFPWVDPERIVLMGQSEGGVTTANYPGDGLAARVILGWTCQIPWPPLWGLRGDRETPVLAVVSKGDAWFKPWYLAGHCGEDMDGFADARSVVLDATMHHILRLPDGQRAVAEFLDRVAPAAVD